MTSFSIPRLSSALLASLLCCALAFPQEPSASSARQEQNPSGFAGDEQASASKTASDDAQLSMTPRPNPKAAKKAAELGEKSIAEGRPEEALAYYQEAARYAPQDQNLVERAAQLRSKVVRDHVDAAERDALAGHADIAVEELAKALLIDPGNTIVAERAREMKAMNDGPLPKSSSHIEGLPELKPKPGKQNLNLRGDTRTVYQQLADLFGLKVAFDPDLTGRPVQLRLDNVDFETAAKVLGMEASSFFVPLTSTLLFVAQDSAEKRRQFAPVAQEFFPLSDAVSPEDMTELLRLVKEMTGALHVELDTHARAISARDTPERLALIGELIHQAEKARGEVLLDVEILEVDRNKARDLGILPASTARLISLTPNLLTQLQQAKDLATLITLLAGFFGGSGSGSSGSLSPSSVIPPLTVVGGGKTTFLLTLPAAAAQFSDALSLVHSGRQVLLRAQDGKPASFFVGDRVPITLSLLSGSLGATTFTPGAPTSGILPSTAYNVGTGPVALVADDFRNLGFLDLAVLNELDNTITILQNQGSGLFVEPTGSLITLGAARAAPPVFPSLASATLTNSGFHDLLVADPVGNTVRVFLSNGDDTFKEAAGSPITVAQQPSAILTGDFNADGHQDFVVTNFTDNTFSLFFGNGDGTFTQAIGSPFMLPSGVTGPIAMISADFNADGNVDLAIVNRTTDNVSILLGDGKGNFTQATNSNSPIAVGKAPVAIGTADFNADGRADLAVLNQTDNTLSVLLGNGDGTFTLAPNSPIATGQSPTAIAVDDYNGDGIPDIAVTDPQTNSVSLFLGQGNGGFATGFEVPAGTNPTAILATTLGGGSTDVAVTDDPSGTTGEVTVILNTPGIFASAGLGGSNGGVAQQPYPGAQYEDIGVKIKATPTLHPNGDVTLQLEFEIRSLSGSSVNGIPIITNRTLSQTARLVQDEPAIIAGLLDNQETRTLTGLPGFASVPVASYAFGQRNTTAENTELLILVTPRKLRLRDRISRTVFAGHDTGPSRIGPPARAPQ